jgi:arsenate reductase
MAKAIIYHNPRCSKSRQTLDVLKNSGVDFEIIEYLKTAPSAAKLTDICKGLNLEPIELIRTKDKLFKELGLNKKDERTRSEWLKLMSENPGLIERPIVEYKDKYAMGRPPESIKSILD